MTKMTLTILILTASLLPVTAQEAQPGGRPQGRAVPRIDGSNLEVLTAHVQKVTGKEFIWTPELGLNGRIVNYRGESELDPETYFMLYKHFLERHNLALVPVDGGGDGKERYKIVMRDQAYRMGLPIEDAPKGSTDRFVTRLFKLKFIAPRDAQIALVQLVANPMGIHPVDNSGVLMVTDYDYNIARIEKMIELIDIERPDVVMRVMQLKHALATDVQGTLNELVQVILASSAAGRGPVVPGMPGQPEQVRITADKRTNSVVILAQPQRMEQIIELVAKLDTEAGFETAGIYFIGLRHADAEEIAKTLNDMFGKTTSTSSATGTPSATPTLPTETAPAPSTGAPSHPLGKTEAPTIVADKRTNTLMVLTDRNTFRTIETVVNRLDQRRPQVLIKATVIEIRATDDFDLGVELSRLADPEGRIIGIGRTNFGYSTLAPFPAPPAAPETFIIQPKDSAGLMTAAVKDNVFNIGFMIKALQEKAQVNVLDQPEIVTVDHGFAKITVGDQVPVTTDTITATGLVQTAFKEFLNAETVLEISPHISEGSYIRLETKVKIEKFAKSEQTNTNIPPPKSNREIDTKAILVPSGHTVVIGGIVTEDDSDAVTGVPLLADIPLLGLLFRRERDSEFKRTLHIFITPHILEDDSFADLKGLTRERSGRLDDLRGRPVEGFSVEGPPEAGVKPLFQFEVKEEEKK